jgi:hypothetical protein
MRRVAARLVAPRATRLWSAANSVGPRVVGCDSGTKARLVGRTWLVRGLVLGHHVRGYPASIADLDALSASPLADIGLIVTRSAPSARA